MKTPTEYRALALESLRGNWTPAVIATFVFLLIVSFFMGGSNYYTAWRQTASASISLLPAYLVVVPLSFGYVNALRRLYLNSDVEVTYNMFRIPLKFYIDVVWTMFYMCVKIFLWSLLLVVPGIIKALAYAMTPYVLADEPQLNAGEAIAKSARMMQGHKHQLLLLELSFIGWIFLGVLTGGLGMLWVEPYMNCSLAAFYEDVKAEFEQRVELDRLA